MTREAYHRELKKLEEELLEMISKPGITYSFSIGQ
jgi:hypothetical protein